MEQTHGLVYPYLLTEPSQLFLVDPCEVGEVDDVSLEAVAEFFVVFSDFNVVLPHFP